jgi:hypothetical protein
MVPLEISGPPTLLFEPMKQHMENRQFHSIGEVGVIVRESKCKSLIPRTTIE